MTRPSRDEVAALIADKARLEAEIVRLSESERMYRFSAELAGRLVWVADAEGNMLFLDHPFVALTGMTVAEGLGLGWLAVVHPDDLVAIEALWTHSIATGEPYLAEFRVRRADGSWRMIRCRAMAARDGDGAISRWYGTTEDIEEEAQNERARQAAEAALRESEALYRNTLEMSQQIAWTSEPDGTGLVLSDRFRELTGLAGAPGEATEAVHPDDRDEVIDCWRRALAGAGKYNVRFRMRMKDGSYRHVRVRGAPRRDGAGNVLRWYGVTEDVHEQERAEAELRRMQAELIHVSRLSAMGTMASTLAHELNQPLAALSNFLSGTKRIAERPNVPREVLVDALDGAEAAARRASEILRRLRDLVSRGKVAVQLEPLPQLIDEACVLAFVDEGALGISHRLSLDPKAAWVRVDRIQIQQVLINLVRNAAEAMAGSGDGHGAAHAREIVISTKAKGRMIEIAVADTGPGIAPCHMESLFSEFMTTKSDGMGLGLPISRTIVEAHGGEIRAENRPHGGAAFIFTLPKARGKAKRV